MPSRHLLDPELGPLIDLLGGEDRKPGEISPALAEMLARPAPTSDKVEQREIGLPGPEGEPALRALLYLPRDDGTALRPAILHIHGGGYVMGAPEMGAANNIRYAGTLGAVVLSVDYRLAPATKHPGLVEDCYAALAYLFGQAGAWRIDPTRIAISGESAGGGLAAALALLARDRGRYPIAYQHLIFPMIDDRTAVDAAPSPYAGQYVWTQASNRHGWESLLDVPPGSDGVSCYAAAARAEDLAGLPPTYIACGALDLFVDENIVYAQRLIKAGVPTELHIYPGAPHGFQMIPSRVGEQAARDTMAALGKALLPTA